MIHFLKYFFISILIFSCHSNSSKENRNIIESKKSSLKYTKNVEMITYGDYQEVIIKNPINQYEIIYYLVDSHKDIPKNLEGKKIIRTPLNKIVVTSTTHIAMLELLGVEKSLIGFPQTYFVSSEKTRQRIDSGLIKELGNVQQLNTEILLIIKPDLIMTFEISGSNKTMQELDKKGFNILVNTDWLEETPLGRVEWIKLYGALFDKQEKADSLFKSIEKNYLDAVKIAQKATKKPSILSGIVFNDVWNLPAGKSLEAQLLKDANTHYLWSDTEGTGSLSLSIEAVLNKAKDADIWVASGIYTSRTDLTNSNGLYQYFNPIKKKQVYSYAHLRGKTGGYIYFETAPIRPDLVLKDLIKIAHPELMRHYDFTFYKRLEK
ncbi:MAG: ABC transporter substrate-binding protein [Flavobacteriaceae bacterium]|nr:ABC transporter substrate-binding protein [Flavobacteriaceae bacterium]